MSDEKGTLEANRIWLIWSGFPDLGSKDPLYQYALLGVNPRKLFPRAVIMSVGNLPSENEDIPGTVYPAKTIQ